MKNIFLSLCLLINFKLYSQGALQGGAARIIIHGTVTPFADITVKCRGYTNNKKPIASTKSSADGMFTLEFPIVINTYNTIVKFSSSMCYDIFISKSPFQEGMIFLFSPHDDIPSKKYEVKEEINVLLKQKDSLKTITNNPLQDNDQFGVISWNKEKRSFVYSGKNKNEEKNKDFTLKADQPIILQNILFESNKSTLQKSSFEELNKLVEHLKKNKKAIIEISGYTDNSGNKDVNLKLSLDRANSVRDYLIQNGIEAGRIKTKGYGDIKPIALNDTEDGRQKNRRIEVRLIQ